MELKYYKHKLKNLLVITKIVTVHYFEFSKSFASHSESHDFWELVYAEKGNIVCTANGADVELKEGEIIFHKPGVTHALRADGKRAPNVFIVSFECKNEAMRFFEDRKMTVNKSLLPLVFAIIAESKQTFNLPYSDPSLRKMNLRADAALGGEQVLKNYLELFLIDLMREESKRESSDAVFLPLDKFDEIISDRVIEYMKEHLNERISVDDIIGILHYSKSYIFRQFKKTTGYSLMTYFIKLKINRAKRLLRETEMPISEIAESLAFDDSNYFSKTFKRMTGYTPTTYRKMRRSAAR